VIVRFVDSCEIVDHHCFKLSFHRARQGFPQYTKFIIKPFVLDVM